MKALAPLLAISLAAAAPAQASEPARRLLGIEREALGNLAADRMFAFYDRLVLTSNGTPVGRSSAPGAGPSLAALSEGLDPSTARRRLVARIARDFGGPIADAARRAGVSPAFLLAVVAAESAGNPRAVSPVGARGLGQLMPGTAARFGVSDSFDPAQNLRGAATYLDILLDLFDGDPVLALAGYNAGEGAVARNGGVPPYAETRAYIPRVLSFWRAARDLCDRPTVSARDGCGLRAGG